MLSKVSINGYTVFIACDPALDWTLVEPEKSEGMNTATIWVREKSHAIRHQIGFFTTDKILVIDGTPENVYAHPFIVPLMAPTAISNKSLIVVTQDHVTIYQMGIFKRLLTGFPFDFDELSNQWEHPALNAAMAVYNESAAAESSLDWLAKIVYRSVVASTGKLHAEDENWAAPIYRIVPGEQRVLRGTSAERAMPVDVIFSIVDTGPKGVCVRIGEQEDRWFPEQLLDLTEVVA